MVVCYFRGTWGVPQQVGKQMNNLIAWAKENPILATVIAGIIIVVIRTVATKAGRQDMREAWARGSQFSSMVTGRDAAEFSSRRCETCDCTMRVCGGLQNIGGVSLSNVDMMNGIGVAEQCFECQRVYCRHCYPARQRNTCVCGQGRDKTHHVRGGKIRGSLRLVRIQY